MSRTAGDLALRESVRPGDEESVQALVAETGFFSKEEEEIAAELVHERLHRGAASGYEFVIAEDGERLLGYACYGRVPCSTVSWDLYWIVVAPAAQGGGLGRRILARAEERIASAGGWACYAETSGRDLYAPTRAFYERRGYALAAVFPDFYAPGDAKHVFAKRLAAPGDAFVPPTAERG